MTFSIDQASTDQLHVLLAELEHRYANFRQQGLDLDLTRGKPSSQQLALSDALDGILAGDYRAPNGTDLRNYGGLDGIAEAKTLFADVLGVDSTEIFIGGNSSLSLMHYTLWFATHLGLRSESTAWNKQTDTIKVLCPCPGYDRHFSLCAELGLEMIPVPLTGEGPDMDVVEQWVRTDRDIKAMWCVPRFSNPTGEVYSDATVRRIAELGTIASDDFLVLWDNAYAVHAFSDDAPQLANIRDLCRIAGTENNVVQFGSTSKITFAGAGVSFLSSGDANLSGFKKHFGMASIGSDKINQMRHVKLLKDKTTILQHMRGHADIIAPKFKIVSELLKKNIGDSGMGRWSKPQGGYFIDFNTMPGLAKSVVALAASAGVKLTPAGATYPHGLDPDDCNIRLAPTYPSPDDVTQATEVFCTCVALASIRHQLASH